jgi:CRP/FNR family transcriptional regulator, cyclic AMP receptor protein
MTTALAQQEPIMPVTDLLQSVALFAGLTAQELEAVAGICVERHYPAGSTIIQQGDMGDEMYVIQSGQVDILLVGYRSERPVVVLGKGQILGEMSLVDHGYRSATARAAEPTAVQVLRQDDFTSLCERDTHIGYVVMRNLAADISFKLRHQHLATM